MKIVNIFQILIGLGIIILILLQQRGVLGGSFFGFQTEFLSKRRGLEQQIFYFTWILIIIFILLFIYKLITL